MKSGIKATLIKNNVEIVSESATSIQFIPWPVNNDSISAKLKGVIFWNPLNDYIVFQYHIYISFEKDIQKYNRCLKWYLSKWNMNNSRVLNKNSLHFMYPGNENGEIILQASSKTKISTLDKKIRLILIQLNDIIEEEGEIIMAISEGNLPEELKHEILEEIKIMLSEINDVQED